MRDRFDWAGKPSTDSAEVMQQYDEMAPTYDDTLLNDWGYSAPAVAADLLAGPWRDTLNAATNDNEPIDGQTNGSSFRCPAPLARFGNHCSKEAI